MFNFLQNRINEALDEDMAQRRRVLDLTRKHVSMIQEGVLKNQELNDNQADELNKIILSFVSTLDDYVNKIEADNEPIKNVGILIYRYNLLSNTLKKLGFQTLPTDEKLKYSSDLDDLIPKIEELLRYADINDFTDKDQLNQILRNFQGHSYSQIAISPVKYTQGLYMEGRIEYNELAGEVLKNHQQLINESVKKYLSLAETGKIQQLINELKKIGSKIKSDKHVTDDMMKRILEIDEEFLMYLDIIPQRSNRIKTIIEQLQNLAGIYEKANNDYTSPYSMNFLPQSQEREVIKVFKKQIPNDLKILQNIRTYKEEYIQNQMDNITTIERLMKQVKLIDAEPNYFGEEQYIQQPEEGEDFHLGVQDEEEVAPPDVFDFFQDDQTQPAHQEIEDVQPAQQKENTLKTFIKFKQNTGGTIDDWDQYVQQKKTEGWDYYKGKLVHRKTK
jgi:hypothetical protein